MLLAAPRGERVVGWSLLGWLVMSVTGVVGGSWLVAKHGSLGWGFFAALAACMLARLLFGGAGALAAALRGPEAPWAYLAGLGVGYLPLQVFETGWFLRRSKSGSTQHG